MEDVGGIGSNATTIPLSLRNDKLKTKITRVDGHRIGISMDPGPTEPNPERGRKVRDRGSARSLASAMQIRKRITKAKAVERREKARTTATSSTCHRLQDG